MSDPLDIANIATHGGTAILGAGGVGAFMRWLSGKEAQEVSTQLALMAQKIDQLVMAAAKTEGLGERVALLEAAVKAAHERLDRREDDDAPPRRKR